MLQIKESIALAAPAGTVALLLRQPQSIEAFPGVEHASVGQPGVHIDLAVPLMGIRLKDRVLLAWGRPKVVNEHHLHSFGIEGGRWLHGHGEVDVEELADDQSSWTINWEMDLPLGMSMIPGVRFSLKRWLVSSTRRWMREMKKMIETAPARAIRLTPADIGA